MKYKAQFSKGWQGTWVFDALNDFRAWETVKDYIKEHTKTVMVDISEIWELDKAGKNIRKLDDYEDYFKLYKINFENGDCILKIFKDKNDFFVWNKAKRDIKKEYNCNVSCIEELDKISKNPVRKLDGYNECKKKYTTIKEEDVKCDDIKEQEKAIYKAYFSDGECSGPYISIITENDMNALDIARFKLKQHAEYNKIDVNKIKVTKVEEINENMLFEVNLLRKEEKKNRII